MIICRARFRLGSSGLFLVVIAIKLSDAGEIYFISGNVKDFAAQPLQSIHFIKFNEKCHPTTQFGKRNRSTTFLRRIAKVLASSVNEMRLQSKRRELHCQKRRSWCQFFMSFSSVIDRNTIIVTKRREATKTETKYFVGNRQWWMCWHVTGSHVPQYYACYFRFRLQRTEIDLRPEGMSAITAAEKCKSIYWLEQLFREFYSKIKWQSIAMSCKIRNDVSVFLTEFSVMAYAGSSAGELVEFLVAWMCMQLWLVSMKDESKKSLKMPKILQFQEYYSFVKTEKYKIKLWCLETF